MVCGGATYRAGEKRLVMDFYLRDSNLCERLCNDHKDVRPPPCPSVLLCCLYIPGYLTDQLYTVLLLSSDDELTAPAVVLEVGVLYIRYSVVRGLLRWIQFELSGEKRKQTLDITYVIPEN